MSRNQSIKGWFPRLTLKAVYGKIPVVRILIRLIAIVETIEGMDGIEILKPLHRNGEGWKIRLNGSAEVKFPPDGWEAREVTLFTGEEKIKVTIIVKSDTAEDTNITVTPYGSTDVDLLLQVVGEGELNLGKGHFKA